MSNKSKNKRGGSKIKKRDFLPKAKPKVTEGDKLKKVLKSVFQASVQYPYLVTKGLLTKDKDSVKKGFKVLDKLKKQKGKIKKGDVKTTKVQKALKMVRTDYRKGGMVMSTVDNRKKK